MEIIRSGRRVHFGQFEMDELVTVLPHRRDIVRAPGICPVGSCQSPMIFNPSPHLRDTF